MAIHPNYPGLSADVVVDGDEPLREYDDNESLRPHIVTKYVEVESDTHFGVRYTIPRGLHGTCGVRSNLIIDGKSVRSYTHSNKQIERHSITNRLDSMLSSFGGSKYSQKFRFSQLRIDSDEEDSDESKNKQLRNVGVLTLRLSFIDSITTRDLPNKALRSFPQDSDPVPKEKLPTLGTVTEKSLKGEARSHQASLGVLEFRGVCQPNRSENIYDMGKPFATFQFKYRSLSALKSLHVISSTANPPLYPPIQSMASGMSRERPDDVLAAHQENVTRTQEGKQEVELNVKRKTNRVDVEGEVEFVSSKRLKCLPTRGDEVIVLD